MKRWHVVLCFRRDDALLLLPTTVELRRRARCSRGGGLLTLVPVQTLRLALGLDY